MKLNNQVFPLAVKKLCLSVLMLFSGSVYACYPDVVGTVTYVSDGDTIIVKTADNPDLKIRLAEIDAPEVSHFGSLEQPYGNESKTLLSNLILNKQVTITPHAIDIYGRTLATVDFEGVNVNKYMVKKGAAWAYTYFVIDKSILTLQKKAKASGLGLWASANPIAPWTWRDTH